MSLCMTQCGEFINNPVMAGTRRWKLASECVGFRGMSTAVNHGQKERTYFDKWARAGHTSEGLPLRGTQIKLQGTYATQLSGQR